MLLHVSMCLFPEDGPEAPKHVAALVILFSTISYMWAGYLSRYGDWLRAERSGDRIPVGARFFTNVQTGPGAHLASCTMGTESFSGVKRPGRGADHPPPSSAEVENE
jgi:hypothetical protein